MIKFAFIIALVTSDGQLEMKGNYVETCPDKESFVQVMEDLKAKGELKDWDAICVDLSKIGEQANAAE